MKKYLPLGAEVRILGSLQKKQEWISGTGTLRTEWRPVPFPPLGAIGTGGVIVGVRTLSCCDTNIVDYDGACAPHNYRHFQAYLVAYNLHRKPIHCLLDQVEPINEVAS